MRVPRERRDDLGDRTDLEQAYGSVPVGSAAIATAAKVAKPRPCASRSGSSCRTPFSEASNPHWTSWAIELLQQGLQLVLTRQLSLPLAG
jgi:hypothetical protein